MTQVPSDRARSQDRAAAIGTDLIRAALLLPLMIFGAVGVPSVIGGVPYSAALGDGVTCGNALAVSPGAWPGATLMVSTGV